MGNILGLKNQKAYENMSWTQSDGNIASYDSNFSGFLWLGVTYFFGVTILDVAEDWWLTCSCW